MIIRAGVYDDIEDKYEKEHTCNDKQKQIESFHLSRPCLSDAKEILSVVIIDLFHFIYIVYE